MKTKLTPAFIAKATAAPGAERSIFWDETMAGFGFQVTARGARAFVIQYRVGGRSRRMAIDGVLTLDKARREARALLGVVAKGGDPLGERRRQKAMTANTFKSIAEEFHRREGKGLRSRAWRERVLERLVFPVIGDRPIESIRRTDIVRLLDKIEDENGQVMADRTLAIVRKILNWHASRSDDFRSPIVRSTPRANARERARARILSDDELRAIWAAAEAFPGPFGCFMRFTLLTATRRSEAAHARFSELSDGEWLIPAARYKSGVDHLIPFSMAARGVLAAIPRISGSDFVFTSDGRRPLGDFSGLKRRFDPVCGVGGWRLHDLRRTARSLMSRAGVASDHAERCLGHVIGGVRGVYDRHAYFDEKKHAFEVLAAQIDRILNPQANVVPLARVAAPGGKV